MNLIKYINDKITQLSNQAFLEKAPKEVVKNTESLLIEAQNKLKNLDDKQIEERILKLRNELEETKQQILDIDSKDFDINKYILEHLRNSLAHGNIKFSNDIDINDISNTKIIFEDFHECNKTFEGEITLGQLLKELSNKKYLESIYFDNYHFNKA